MVKWEAVEEEQVWLWMVHEAMIHPWRGVHASVQHANNRKRLTELPVDHAYRNQNRTLKVTTAPLSE
ncbi:MAG: hypothetical protein WAT41_12030 [Flavobacteriales bacterium]